MKKRPYPSSFIANAIFWTICGFGVFLTIVLGGTMLSADLLKLLIIRFYNKVIRRIKCLIKNQ